jgi:hypothetical protein
MCFNLADTFSGWQRPTARPSAPPAEHTVPVASAPHAPGHGRAVTTSGVTVNIPIE